MKIARVLTPVFIVLFAASLALAQTPAAATSPAQGAKKVQKVKLSFDDKGYVVTPAKLTKGVPVEMDVDLDTVKGCMRTVVIDSFKVKKTVKAGDTKIEFTPDKSGDIGIICGMNMGKGQFTVIESK